MSWNRMERVSIWMESCGGHGNTGLKDAFSKRILKITKGFFSLMHMIYNS